MNSSDAIMVDKGFLIDDLCISKSIQIIRPPFLKNKIQFQKKDLSFNDKFLIAIGVIVRITLQS
jgi:hypothetical protein